MWPIGEPEIRGLYDEIERLYNSILLQAAYLQESSLEGLPSDHDIEVTRGKSDSVQSPVFPYGGAGNSERFAEAAIQGGSVVGAAGCYKFKHRTNLEAKSFLQIELLTVPA